MDTGDTQKSARRTIASAATAAVLGIGVLGASAVPAQAAPAGGTGLRVQPVIKADRDCASAAAASVLAKVARDDLMVGRHDEAPAYQWARNKGYASAEHRAAIRSHGLSPHHRASWAIADAPTLF